MFAPVINLANGTAGCLIGLVSIQMVIMYDSALAFQRGSLLACQCDFPASGGWFVIYTRLGERHVTFLASYKYPHQTPAFARAGLQARHARDVWPPLQSQLTPRFTVVWKWCFGWIARSLQAPASWTKPIGLNSAQRNNVRRVKPTHVATFKTAAVTHGIHS